MLAGVIRGEKDVGDLHIEWFISVIKVCIAKCIPTLCLYLHIWQMLLTKENYNALFFLMLCSHLTRGITFLALFLIKKSFRSICATDAKSVFMGPDVLNSTVGVKELSTQISHSSYICSACTALMLIICVSALSIYVIYSRKFVFAEHSIQ